MCIRDSPSSFTWWAPPFILLWGRLHWSHSFCLQSTQYVVAVGILSKSPSLSSTHTSHGTSAAIPALDSTFLTSTSRCKKKWCWRPSSPLDGISNSFLHMGQGTSSPRHLSLRYPWRHLRQNVCRQGSDFGLSNISRQIGQVVRSTVTDAAVAMVQQFSDSRFWINNQHVRVDSAELNIVLIHITLSSHRHSDSVSEVTCRITGHEIKCLNLKWNPMSWHNYLKQLFLNAGLQTLDTGLTI